MSKRKTAEELEEIIERLQPWAMDEQDSNTLRVLRDAVKSIDNLLAKVGSAGPGPQGFSGDALALALPPRRPDIRRFEAQMQMPSAYHARVEPHIEGGLREELVRELARGLAEAGAIRFHRHMSVDVMREGLIAQVDVAMPAKNG